MRTSDEIEHVLERFGNQPDSLSWTADTFKYGLYCGKLAALEWLLGHLSTGELCINYDYADFRREQTIEADDLRQRLKEDPGRSG